MIRRSLPGIIIAICCSGLWAAPVKLEQCPAYNWYHGCGPTSAGMIIGYWDIHGLSNLFDASGSDLYLTSSVRDQISSPAHNAKYDPTPDNASLDVPENTSLACWFRTSVDPQQYGWSYSSAGQGAFTDYGAYRGYAFGATQVSNMNNAGWSTLVSQIDSGRPVMLLVDTNGDSGTDHFVAAFGYEDRGAGGLWYGCYDTYSEVEVLMWKQFRPKALGNIYGVSTLTVVAPPFAWKGSSGDWSGITKWAGGVPARDCDAAWIDNGGTAQITSAARAGIVYVGWYKSGNIEQRSGGSLVAQALKIGDRPGSSGICTVLAGDVSVEELYVALAGSGTFIQNGGAVAASSLLRIGDQAGSSGLYSLAGGSLQTGQLQIGVAGAGRLDIAGGGTSIAAAGKVTLGPGGSWTASSPFTFRASGGGLELQPTDRAAMAALGQMSLVVDSGPAWQFTLEAAGDDLGATASAFLGNTVLKSLTIGGTSPGSVSLVNAFDNNLSSDQADALYVENLLIQPGSRLATNSLKVYFLAGGVPMELRKGDCDVDGFVDDDDLSLLLANWNTDAGWAGGDFSNNGQVSDADLSCLLANWTGQAAVVGEPCTMALILLAAGACRRRVCRGHPARA